MKENKYDDKQFFAQYEKMERSQKGLAGAGEWHAFRQLFPILTGKRVLDLGCGYGWHCMYAAQQGASKVVGTDISEKMLEEAAKRNTHENIEYRQVAIEDVDYPDGSFDVIISSLAFHYVESFEQICSKVHRLLSDKGSFVFSVEHPVFTAYGTQDWYYSEDGSKLHWPVDRYFSEGRRDACFLGETVVKYHKTLTNYLDTLLVNGFCLNRVVEPEPDPVLLDKHPEYTDELRRPMFLLVSATAEK